MPNYTAETLIRKTHDLDAIRAKYASPKNIEQAVNSLAGKMADELIAQTPKKKESSWTDIREGSCR